MTHVILCFAVRCSNCLCLFCSVRFCHLKCQLSRNNYILLLNVDMLCYLKRAWTRGTRCTSASRRGALSECLPRAWASRRTSAAWSWAASRASCSCETYGYTRFTYPSCCAAHLLLLLVLLHTHLRPIVALSLSLSGIQVDIKPWERVLGWCCLVLYIVLFAACILINVLGAQAFGTPDYYPADDKTPCFWNNFTCPFCKT